MKAAIATVATLLTPLAIYLSIQYSSIGVGMLWVGSLIVWRAYTKWPQHWLRIASVALFFSLIVSVAPLDMQLTLKMYPAVVSIVFSSVFAVSLFIGKPVVEQIARKMEGELPYYAIRYTRYVTIFWALLLFCNACVAYVTAISFSDEHWMLYNGLVSYLIIGVAMAVEYVIRLIVRRRYDHSA